MRRRHRTVAVVLVFGVPGPCQAGLEAACLRRPDGEDLLGRGEIGDLGRERFLRGPEDGWQAQQRGVEIEGGQAGPPCGNPADARGAGEKGGQGLGAAEEDFTAALRHQRGVTDELNDVAVALLGMQQNAPPPQLAPIPERLGKRPGGRGEVFEFPAPFIFLPPALPLALGQQGGAKLPMGLGMGRLEAQDLFATGYRRVEIEFLLVKKALVDQGVGMVWAQGQCLAISGHGLDGPAEVLQNQAEVVMGVGVARVEGEFQAAALGGGLEVAALLMDGAQQQTQSRIGRAQADGGLQALDRLIQPVELPEGRAEAAMRLETVGLLLQDRDKQLGGFQRLALPCTGATAPQESAPPGWPANGMVASWGSARREGNQASNPGGSGA